MGRLELVVRKTLVGARVLRLQHDHNDVAQLGLPLRRWLPLWPAWRQLRRARLRGLGGRRRRAVHHEVAGRLRAVAVVMLPLLAARLGPAYGLDDVLIVTEEHLVDWGPANGAVERQRLAQLEHARRRAQSYLERGWRGGARKVRVSGNSLSDSLGSPPMQAKPLQSGATQILTSNPQLQLEPLLAGRVLRPAQVGAGVVAMEPPYEQQVGHLRKAAARLNLLALELAEPPEPVELGARKGLHVAAEQAELALLQTHRLWRLHHDSWRDGRLRLCAFKGSLV